MYRLIFCLVTLLATSSLLAGENNCNHVKAGYYTHEGSYENSISMIRIRIINKNAVEFVHADSAFPNDSSAYRITPLVYTTTKPHNFAEFMLSKLHSYIKETTWVGYCSENSIETSFMFPLMIESNRFDRQALLASGVFKDNNYIVTYAPILNPARWWPQEPFVDVYRPSTADEIELFKNAEAQKSTNKPNYELLFKFK